MKFLFSQKHTSQIATIAVWETPQTTPFIVPGVVGQSNCRDRRLRDLSTDPFHSSRRRLQRRRGLRPPRDADPRRSLDLIENCRLQYAIL